MSDALICKDMSHSRMCENFVLWNHRFLGILDWLKFSFAECFHLGNPLLYGPYLMADEQTRSCHFDKEFWFYLQFFANPFFFSAPKMWNDSRYWGHAFLHSNKPNQRLILGIYDPKSIPDPRDVSQARYLALMGNNWYGSITGGGWCQFSMVLPHLDAILSRIYEKNWWKLMKSA